MGDDFQRFCRPATQRMHLGDIALPDVREQRTNRHLGR